MDKKFKKEVSKRPGGENINYCFSCGSCTATCPISELDNSYNPRLTIKKVLLGFKEEVLDNDNLWKCIQCHRCVAHCPQNVKFADIVRVLRDLAIEEEYYPKSLTAKIDEYDLLLRKLRLEKIEGKLKDENGLQSLIQEMTGGEKGDG